MPLKLVWMTGGWSRSDDSENNAFLGIKLHAALVFQVCKCMSLLLKGRAILFTLYGPVDYTVIGKKSGMGEEVVWKVVYEDKKR